VISANADRAERAVQNALDFAQSIIATLREPFLVVLDKELQVVKASRSFYQTFQVLQEETENRHVYDLGNRQWDIPKLRSLLEGILLS
jgi:two-component system CheB/CheR fusion protein